MKVREVAARDCIVNNNACGCMFSHHREKERLLVLQRKGLIRELLAVDGFAARAIPLREVSALDLEA